METKNLKVSIRCETRDYLTHLNGLHGGVKAIKPLKKKGFWAWLRRVFRRPRRLPYYIDEMHEYIDPSLADALKKGTAGVIYKKVIHAKWVEGDYGESLKLACSSCGAPFEYRTTFCPDCGAKMTEE